MKKDVENNKKSGNLLMYWLLMMSMIFFAVTVIIFVGFVKIKKEFETLRDTSFAQSSEYETEISNLQQKVALLAERVSIDNEYKSIEEAKKNPFGIPVSGQATIVSEPKDEEDDTENENQNNDQNSETSFEDDLMNPYTLEISLVRGSKIIAAGNGIVDEISEDDLYGYIVKINHQNGYVSIYRYNEEPKVSKGDEVLKGQMIFEVTKNKGTLAYHILYENTYINPFDVIEISG